MGEVANVKVSRGKDEGATATNYLDPPLRGSWWCRRSQRNLVADCGIRQVIGLGVALAGDVSDGELERARQLAADPVQGIEARAAAGVLALHLADDHLGVRIDV